MMAVRSAHLNLNKTREFAIDQWINNLNRNNPQSTQYMRDTWRYCKRITQDHSDQYLLLWRGIEMVEILTMLAVDIDSLCAALLFPLIKAKIVNEEKLEKVFGKVIVSLIYGVLNIDKIYAFKTIKNNLITSEQINNIRRILLAMVEDLRCVLSKLAERVTHLSEIESDLQKKRILAAKESTNIYVPLTDSLGIEEFKWELEDYCFRYLNPDEYKQIATLLHERRIDREEYIKKLVDTIRQEINKKGVYANVYGRPKHIYSIWRKMQRKSISFKELFDLRAIRIVTKRLQDCYGALGTVHTLYHHLPSEFDDYIAHPKANGYQSIHTVVFGPQGKTVEIQIRTHKMHQNAELGIAAHWKYKESSLRNNARAASSKYEDSMVWIRELFTFTLQKEISDFDKRLDQVRSQVFNDRVYVFTPKGEIVELPFRTQHLNFAYYIYSDIGHRCIGVKVNGRIVPFTYQVCMSDHVVKIITQKNYNPSFDWINLYLGYLTTNRCRSKIKSWFIKRKREKIFYLNVK